MSSSFHGISAGNVHSRPGYLGPSASLFNGIVAWWNLDEESGTRYDAVGSVNLADVNTVGFTENGVIGNAASFVRDNNEALQASTKIMTGEATLSGWFKILNNDEDNQKIFGTAPGGNYGVHTYQQGSDYLLTRFSDGNASYSITNGPGNTITYNKWYLICLWYDSGTNKFNLQLNNEEPMTVSGNGLGVDPGGGALYMGGGTLGDFPSDSCFDLAGVWNRNLSAVERTQLYNGGAGIAYPF